MDYHPILDNLYVGSYLRDASDVACLARAARIDAVLNLQTDEDIAYWGVDWPDVQRGYEAGEIALARVPIRDFDPLDLRARLAAGVDALERLVGERRRVYVHCTAGIGRAPAVAIAWLAWYRGFTLADAVDDVRNCRPCSPFVEAIALATQDRLATAGASMP